MYSDGCEQHLPIPLCQPRGAVSLLIEAQRSLLTSHNCSVRSRFPAERRGYGLVESRLARTALRLVCSRSIGRGCSSVAERPGNREVGGSIPFSFSATSSLVEH